jgi:hypothetical protein
MDHSNGVSDPADCSPAICFEHLVCQVHHMNGAEL